MKLMRSRWIRYLLSMVSFLLVISLLAHPELRMLAPFLDAIGLDGFLFLVCAPWIGLARKCFLRYAAPVLSPGLARVRRSNAFRRFCAWTARHSSFLSRDEYVGPIIPLLLVGFFTFCESQL